MADNPERPARHPLPAFVPVPRLKERSNGWNEDVQRRFIEALADTGSVTSACRAVGRSDQSAYALRRHPEGKSFRKAWQAALDCGVRRIEDVAMERALHGVEVPVYHFGEIVGTRRIYNDYLLMFMLRNRAPKRFAADSARSLSGLDKHVLERHRKKWREEWRREWEEEQKANSVSPAELRASINRKIEAVRQRIEASHSPRAYDLKLMFDAQSLADKEAGWRPGEIYEPYAERAAELMPKYLEQQRAKWPQRQFIRGVHDVDDDCSEEDLDEE